MFDVRHMLWQALGLDSSLFAAIGADPVAALPGALQIAALAAVSAVLGQLVILVLSRVRGVRLVVVLAIGIVWSWLLQTAQAVVIWALASLVLQTVVPLRPVIVVALVATAPLVFEVFTALPHLGTGLGKLLQVWSFLVLVIGIDHAYGAGFWRALLFALAGWGVMQAIAHGLRGPIGAVASRAWTTVTGTPTMVTAGDILSGAPLIPVTPERELARW